MKSIDILIFGMWIFFGITVLNINSLLFFFTCNAEIYFIKKTFCKITQRMLLNVELRSYKNLVFTGITLYVNTHTANVYMMITGNMYWLSVLGWIITAHYSGYCSWENRWTYPLLRKKIYGIKNICKK